jgi:predicted RNase H-like HicB family nuclease
MKRLLKTPSCVAHVADGNNHGVAAALNVLIVPAAEGGYYAQGIEIDFAATGKTEEEVREHFQESFVATIRRYIDRGRSLSGLFKASTPPEYRQAYFSGSSRQVFVCAIGHEQTGLPDDASIPGVLNFITKDRAEAHA